MQKVLPAKWIAKCFGKMFFLPKKYKKLAACHYDNENPNVRRAFIFCLYCGLRFCDVKRPFTYKNVDYANRLLKFEQSKTKGHSASSGV